jgi:hypothetical protein
MENMREFAIGIFVVLWFVIGFWQSFKKEKEGK